MADTDKMANVRQFFNFFCISLTLASATHEVNKQLKILPRPTIMIGKCIDSDDFSLAHPPFSCCNLGEKQLLTS